MTADRKELKREARKAIRETKPSPVLVTLGLVAVLLVMQVLSMSINGYFTAYKTMYEGLMAGELLYVEPEAASGFGWILTLALDLMSMVLSVGYVLYTMRAGRRVKVGFGDIFDAFGVFFRAVWITILPSLLIGLCAFIYILPVTFISAATGWLGVMFIGLPLLIPMVMVSYSFRLADYLMLDNRQQTCVQCVMMSRMVMKGRKWELFKLDLSFIGWGLLRVIPFVGLWVRPYVSVTRALWYDAAMRDHMKALEDMPGGPSAGDQPPAGPEE